MLLTCVARSKTIDMWNRDVMANMLASSAVDHGYEPLLGQTKD
jgi:hypothetical protein